MVNKKEELNPNKKECLRCQKLKPTTDFYMSNSPNHTDNKFPVCKICIRESLRLENPTSQEAIDSLKAVLLEMNRPFLYTQWISSVEESAKTKRELFGMYYKNVLFNYKSYTWLDSEFEVSNIPSNESTITTNPNIDIQDAVVFDNRNRDDVLRMLGYDPFEYAHPDDKRHLYDVLVDLLDESTLEDAFKLQAVIEMAKGFNQIDKINQAITNITNDVNLLSTNPGGIKSLIASKKDILTSLMKLAEENGISVKHNNQKSKGAGTLTGIIKTLQEKGFEEGEINLFDIETAQGIRQVADLSNKSIVAQLQFDENDYTGMILEQREIIQELDKKVTKFEEENRLLKKEIIKYRKLESDSNE